MYKVVLLRHGESQWNKANLFAGWSDPDLEENGKQQAARAAELLLQNGYTFDIAYTSLLKRAIRTLWITLDGMDLMWIPEFKSWRLNERHYGALQGLNRSETATEYGEDQVNIWRRSYDTQPPHLTEDDERHPVNDPRYQHLNPQAIPKSESLKDTYDRMLPYWMDVISEQVKSGKKVLIVGHGNTLRALAKHLGRLTEEEVAALNIPVGEPLIYELDDSLLAVKHYYLSGEEEIQKGIQAQIAQGKAGSIV